MRDALLRSSYSFDFSNGKSGEKEHEKYVQPMPRNAFRIPTEMMKVAGEFFRREELLVNVDIRSVRRKYARCIY